MSDKCGCETSRVLVFPCSGGADVASRITEGGIIK